MCRGFRFDVRRRGLREHLALVPDEISYILNNGCSFVRDITDNEQLLQLVLLAVVDVLPIEVHQARNYCGPRPYRGSGWGCERIATNVGIAGDEGLNELAFNQNIVVTVPGNTRFYIVLGTGSTGRESGSRQAAASVPVGSKATTVPSLEELRQLIQLRQELSAMYQQNATPAAASETPQ